MQIKHLLYFLFLFTLTSCGTTKSLKQENNEESRLSEDTKRQFDYYFYEGLRLKELQKFDQALETFRMCLSIDSLDAGAQNETGLLYAAIGLNKEALHCMETAVKLQPQNWWYNFQLITVYSNLKNWSGAIDVATKVQQVYPNKEDIYNILTSLYKQTKQYDKAIAAYDKLESLVGIDQSISFEKFRLYVLLNKTKKGITEIDKLVNKYPTETRYQVLRGDIFMQQKMPEKAFEIYQQVLKSDPQNAYVYISLSEYYKSVNQSEKSMEAIVSALKSDDLDVDTKVDVLGQYVEKVVKDSTKLDEAEMLFKLLVEHYPLEEQVHGYYAVYLQFRGRNEEAGSELESMLNINPKNPQTWLRLIQIYLGEKKFENLVEISNRAIDNLPKNPAWYFYKGIAQFQLTEYQSALETYHAGLPFIEANQAGMKSDFYAQIADIYFKAGQKDSAFMNYENSLLANPKNVMVMNNYAYYLSLEKKDLRKAEKMSAKTVELEPKNSTYLDTYAWILYQEENYSLAKFYIERAMDNLTKEEDPGIILEHYGDILWMNSKDDNKDDAKALEMWKKSFESGNKTEQLKLKIEMKGWDRK
ncbi:MAG: tetratricopeptide repeat protein [Paludibacter sp.]|nr:tetratricopeptide repeat protein [Paludibacter sp.]